MERIVNIIHILFVIICSICGIINDGALRLNTDNLFENDKKLFFFHSSFNCKDEDNDDDHLLQFNHRRFTSTADVMLDVRRSPFSVLRSGVSLFRLEQIVANGNYLSTSRKLSKSRRPQPSSFSK